MPSLKDFEIALAAVSVYVESMLHLMMKDKVASGGAALAGQLFFAMTGVTIGILAAITSIMRKDLSKGKYMQHILYSIAMLYCTSVEMLQICLGGVENYLPMEGFSPILAAIIFVMLLTEEGCVVEAPPATISPIRHRSSGNGNGNGNVLLNQLRPSIGNGNRRPADFGAGAGIPRHAANVGYVYSSLVRRYFSGAVADMD